MSQQIASASQAEENKIQMLHQLRELKKAIKENKRDIAQLTREEMNKKNQYARDWEKRRQEKLAAGKKVNIVFVCSRPACWGSLKTVCQAFIDDPRCDVKIVAIPEREPKPKLMYMHNIFSDLGAYDYLSKTMQCRVIDGYNAYQKTWLNLIKLDPDYIFFQTPYNALRPNEYHSSLVSSYAKLCFVTYGMPTFEGEIRQIADPPDFMKDLSFIFTQSQEYSKHLTRYYKSFFGYKTPEIILSGEPRFDKLPADFGLESPLWKFPRSSGKLRAVWTPRWTTLGNHTHFFDYKENFFQLCEKDQNIDFICRPHPLTFAASISTGAMTAEEVKAFKDEYNTRPNMTLDQRPCYQDTFFSSDVLVTDMSSIFHDYFISGKPIIYCHKSDNFNQLSRNLANGFYWAYNWDDVITYLRMIKDGKDPLYATRKKLIKDNYYFPPEGAGKKIKDYMISNFFQEGTV